MMENQHRNDASGGIRNYSVEGTKPYRVMTRRMRQYRHCYLDKGAAAAAAAAGSKITTYYLIHFISSF
jgi:hypothetical protein